MSMSVSPRAWTGVLVAAGVCVAGATPALAAGVGGIGSGRLVPSVAAVIGLISVAVATRALTRRDHAATGNRPPNAIVAGVMGLISLAVGGLHSANAAGGVGTGNGLAGAVVAMGVGLIGMVLSGLALARFRRPSG